MIHQIICCICSIGKSLLGTSFHIVLVELHSLKHPIKKLNTSICCIHGIEGHLLVLLHILVICKWNSLHGSKQGHQSTIHSSSLTTDKLRNIRILLLRHNTASSTVSIINLHKSVFIRIPDYNLLRKSTEVHHYCRKC